MIAGLAPAAGAAPARLQLRSVRCWPAVKCHGPRSVSPGSSVLISGGRFERGLRAVFAVRSHRARAVATHLLSPSRLLARVPADAVSGRIYLRGRGHVRSNSLGLLVVGRAHGRLPIHAPASHSPFDGNGMWIWYVSRSSGGDPNAIIAQARQHAISTVFVKSSDGSSAWSQFSPTFVSQLKAAGLRVCAWQYVLGKQPEAEAQLGVQAVHAGADCLVIDAEQEYEGRYGEADAYLRALRQGIGPDYPLGLAGFPYVDNHPAFPYSVFFGPGGAQFNLPQVYWKAIGVSVDSALAHSYRFNRPYGRMIAPLGQAYDSTAAVDIVRFRQLARADGASGVSWWDWQEAQPDQWQAIGQPLAPFGEPAPSRDYASIGRGSKGDLVVWAQEHLRSAGRRLSVDGDYGPSTQQAVTEFQSGAGLAASGQVDAATWSALLRYPAARMRWIARARSAGAGRRESGPPTAALPARGYEIRARASR